MSRWLPIAPAQSPPDTGQRDPDRNAQQELHRVERVALRNQAAYKCPSSTVAAMTSTEASGTIPSLAERGARTAMLIS
jgi:hypothetical protein